MLAGYTWLLDGALRHRKSMALIALLSFVGALTLQASCPKRVTWTLYVPMWKLPCP